jgi:alkylation response protein AidB-like acyl-CoA dehydrogenase
MDFEFSTEQEQLRESVRRFLADRAPIAYVREMYDEERGTTDGIWRGLAELGATSLLVPEEDGGAGMGMVDAAVVLEELGRAVHPGPYASSAIGATSLIAALADPEQQRLVLPSLATGETVATVGLYEAGRRNEWRTPTTIARYDEAADAWCVTGTKVHVPDAIAADIVLVTADVDGTLGVFSVRADGGSILIEATPTVDGTRKEGRVRLEDAPAIRLGTGDATDAVSATVDRLHTAAVVDGVGAASRALEIALDYAKQRQQFGVPIGSFQAVQHLCVDMARAVELARAAAYYACWAIDDADPDERHRAATMALAFAADELYAVGAGAVQVHAGVGFTWEHDIHLFYKRLLTLQHAGGGSLDQLEELASIALAPEPGV